MNETNLAINKFLDELRQALHGQNAGLIQDAVYDVESHFLYALEEHGTIDFKACADELGTPEEIAQQYIQLEQDAERFLKGPSRPKTSFNGFFEPLSNINDYKAMGYFFIAMPLSVLYFGWLILFGGTSLALSLLVVGLPLLAIFLKVQSLLALFEGQLINTLLGVRMPRRPVRLNLQPSSSGKLMDFIKTNTTGLHGWKVSLYTALHMPLTALYFSLTSLLFIGSLALIISPVVDPIIHWFSPSMDVDIQWYWFPLTSLAGVIGMTLSLHISKALVNLHAGIAGHLLVAK